MADADQSTGFLAFRRDEDGDIHGFAVVPNQDTLEKWKAGSIRPPEATRAAPDLEEPTNGHNEIPKNRPGRATDLLDRFKKSMTSVHSMVDFTSAIAPSMTKVFIERRLLLHAKKHLQFVEDDGTNLIYLFSREHFLGIKRLLDNFDSSRAGYDALPGATVLSLVATFNSYFSEIVRFFLSIHPERYTESDRQISLKELFTRKSLDEVVSQVIDMEIGDLMRGSHTDQVQFVESHLAIKIIGHYERWPNFVEIFERRNLVAHGNLIVNKSYLANCKIAKYTEIEKTTIGQQLSLNYDYLHKATDILSEFGILLVFVLWRKHIADSEEEAFTYLNQTCYDLIRAKRSRLAQRLLDFALHKQRRACSDLVVRMMLINLANSYKKMKNEEKCQEVISSIDWTASGDNFQICIASLQGDVDKVVALMPGLAASKAVTANSFREWPVLDWIRDSQKVNETFEHVYGEPMRNKISEAVATTPMKANLGQDVETEAGGLSLAPDDATRH